MSPPSWPHHCLLITESSGFFCVVPAANYSSALQQAQPDDARTAALRRRRHGCRTADADCRLSLCLLQHFFLLQQAQPDDARTTALGPRRHSRHPSHLMTRSIAHVKMMALYVSFVLQQAQSNDARTSALRCCCRCASHLTTRSILCEKNGSSCFFCAAASSI